ncbi:NAD(P)-binding protein [Pleomassaria siparia CBS 279.74]|uniref:NAD(P)-binding protein n=1 Tax=Pleomassaria siparia CBS 279.74 TaxID=1314801 RepID=A0A6G1JZL9_9PLEO|nr:NAD(P)-binding protein [Pleomassaria siparia CBS 279.74]
MSFQYKHVLLVGATSGIGASMAAHLVNAGVKVTAVGRRKERLDEFVSKHGEEKASSAVFDITKLDKIPAFAEGIIKAHPTIDCIFLNAGIQRRHTFAAPSSVDLDSFNGEITTNFISFVHLTHAFLPFLLAKESATGLVYTGSHISLVPAFSLPAYSASKAALDAFVVCMREQLKSSSVKVMDISAPPVQTELHDFESGPEAGKAFGMPADQFTEEAYKELMAGTENIVIGEVGGSTKEQFLEIAERRMAAVQRLSQLIRAHHS